MRGSKPVMASPVGGVDPGPATPVPVTVEGALVVVAPDPGVPDPPEACDVFVPRDAVVVVGEAAAHDCVVMVLLSSVTAPFRASRRPWIVAPVVAVMDVRARTLPTRWELVPSVAELPTCQKTLHAVPPLRTTTELVEAVINVDEALKTNTASGLPRVLRVKVPVIPSVGPP